MQRRRLALLLLWMIAAPTLHGQNPLPARVTNAITAVCPAVVSVRVTSYADKTTWVVQPDSEQACAQPTIDAFNPADPAHDTADLDAAVTRALDTERLSSAIVWVILKQMYPADTDAQLKTKYGVARTRIVDAFKSEPWK